MQGLYHRTEDLCTGYLLWMNYQQKVQSYLESQWNSQPQNWCCVFKHLKYCICLSYFIDRNSAFKPRAEIIGKGLWQDVNSLLQRREICEGPLFYKCNYTIHLSRIRKGHSSGVPRGWRHCPCCFLLALSDILLRATERENRIPNTFLYNSRSPRQMSVSMSEWKPICRTVKHHLLKLRWFFSILGAA